MYIKLFYPDKLFSSNNWVLKMKLHRMATYKINISLIIYRFITFPFRHTGAIISVSATGTGTAIIARITGTIVDSTVWWNPHISRIANALFSVRIPDADTVWWTWINFTDTSRITMTASVTGWAYAVIRANVVYAFASVRTWIRQTLVQVQLTILTLETGRTVTYIATIIIVTYAVVKTRFSEAFVDIYLAIWSFISKQTIWEYVFIFYMTSYVFFKWL